MLELVRSHVSVDWNGLGWYGFRCQAAHYWVLKAQTLGGVTGSDTGCSGGVMVFRPGGRARVGAAVGIDRTLRTTQWTRASTRT